MINLGHIYNKLTKILRYSNLKIFSNVMPQITALLLLLLLLLSYNNTYEVHTARQTSAYANNAVNSCYIINQSCNVRLIQMKDAMRMTLVPFVGHFDEFEMVD